MRLSITTHNLVMAGTLLVLYAACVVTAHIWARQKTVSLGMSTLHASNCMTDLFVLIAMHLLAAVVILITKISLAPILPLIWNLALIAATGTAVFTLWLYVNRNRVSGPGGMLPFLQGFEIPSMLRAVEPARLAPQVSIINTGMLIAAFAYVQYEKYGMLTVPMGLFIVFWWGYLIMKLLSGQDGIPDWAKRNHTTGLLPLLWLWVVIPVLFSIGGWQLIDYGFGWQIPTWKVASVVIIYLICLFAWNRALSQQANYNSETGTGHIDGKPSEHAVGGSLESGFWKYGRRIDYTLELLVLGCIALTSGATRSPIPYLVPLVYLFYIVHRIIHDEHLSRSRDMGKWDAYCKRIRFRLFPFVY